MYAFYILNYVEFSNSKPFTVKVSDNWFSQYNDDIALKIYKTLRVFASSIRKYCT